MILTEGAIRAGANGVGGWNAKQLAILGIAWPPPKKWIKNCIGMEIDIESYRDFVGLCGVNKKVERQMKPDDKVKEVKEGKPVFKAFMLDPNIMVYNNPVEAFDAAWQLSHNGPYCGRY